MTEQPTFTNLIDYVEGRLSPEAAASVERKIATGDARTESALAWIRTFHNVADRLPLEAPPVRVRYYLRRQFEERAVARTPFFGRLPRQLVAVLTFDSRADLAAAGVRSGDADVTATSLAFSSGAGDVLVDLSPTGDGWLRLDGQVLWADGEESQVLEAHLTGPGFSEDSQTSDNLGRFSFARVPGNVDRLVLQTEAVDISLQWQPSEAP